MTMISNPLEKWSSLQKSKKESEMKNLGAISKMAD